MMDLDSFKSINDAHGHATGDATLRCIAQCLLGAARTTDSVGRLGGDEFAVLLPETDAAQALPVAERLQSLARSAETPVGVTLSWGIATWSDISDNPDESNSARRPSPICRKAPRARSPGCLGARLSLCGRRERERNC